MLPRALEGKLQSASVMSEWNLHPRPRLWEVGDASTNSNVRCVDIRRQFLKRHTERTRPCQPRPFHRFRAVHDYSVAGVRNQHRGFRTTMNHRRQFVIMFPVIGGAEVWVCRDVDFGWFAKIALTSQVRNRA